MGIKRYYRSGGLGTYPIPIAPYEIRIDPEQGYAKQKYVSRIDDIKTGYSIKFSKLKAEELHKMCIDESQHPTAYVIQKGHEKMGLHVSLILS